MSFRDSDGNTYVSSFHCKVFSFMSKSDFVEEITFEGVLYAIILRSNFKVPGISFFTSGEMSQQLGYMNHSKGHIIIPHRHNPVHREVSYTNEVLFVKSGVIRVDFYNDHEAKVADRVLLERDVILLVGGGHGFEVIEDCEIIEVKQGPYVGDHDKARFEPKS